MLQNEYKLVAVGPEAACWSAVVALYEAAFPPEERRPTEAWKELAGQSEQFRLLALADADRLTGFISYWDFEYFVYVEHFAVSPQVRGCGWGQQIFKLLQSETGGRPIVLEVEPPETALAVRRIGFYERLGLTLSNVPYMQPPYRPAGEWLKLLLMSTDEDFLGSNADRVKSGIYARVYGTTAAPPVHN